MESGKKGEKVGERGKERLGRAWREKGHWLILSLRPSPSRTMLIEGGADKVGAKVALSNVPKGPRH